jgi:hypothetical protein
MLAREAQRTAPTISAGPYSRTSTCLDRVVAHCGVVLLRATAQVILLLTFLWLLTDADAKSMSGGYVDGRRVRSGSLESRDRKKIARSVEVAKWIIDGRLYKKRVQQRALS